MSCLVNTSLTRRHHTSAYADAIYVQPGEKERVRISCIGAGDAGMSLFCRQLKEE